MIVFVLLSARRCADLTHLALSWAGWFIFTQTGAPG